MSPWGLGPFHELIGRLTSAGYSDTARHCEFSTGGCEVSHWTLDNSTTTGILAYVEETRGCGIAFQRGWWLGCSRRCLPMQTMRVRQLLGGRFRGGVIMRGGVCVQWFSRTQKCVTLGTTQAEYLATAEAMKEALFLQQV